MKFYYVYILASKKDVTPYISVTNNLLRRVIEHKKGLKEGFTKKYFVNKQFITLLSKIKLIKIKIIKLITTINVFLH